MSFPRFSPEIASVLDPCRWRLSWREIANLFLGFGPLAHSKLSPKTCTYEYSPPIFGISQLEPGHNFLLFLLSGRIRTNPNPNPNPHRVAEKVKPQELGRRVSFWAEANGERLWLDNEVECVDKFICLIFARHAIFEAPKRGRRERPRSTFPRGAAASAA